MDDFRDYIWIAKVIDAGVLNISPNDAKIIESAGVSLTEDITFEKNDDYDIKSKEFLLNSLKNSDICENDVLHKLPADQLCKIFINWMCGEDIPDEYLIPNNG
jgi:hypothetical protein